jgi:hypothetical protein
VTGGCFFHQPRTFTLPAARARCRAGAAFVLASLVRLSFERLGTPYAIPSTGMPNLRPPDHEQEHKNGNARSSTTQRFAFMTSPQWLARPRNKRPGLSDSTARHGQAPALTKELQARGLPVLLCGHRPPPASRLVKQSSPTAWPVAAARSRPPTFEDTCVTAGLWAHVQAPQGLKLGSQGRLFALALATTLR